MPELPEVESVRRTLEPHLLDRWIRGVWVYRPEVINGIPLAYDLLNQGRIKRLLRKGKQLAIETYDRRVICVHLGMSGQLYWQQGLGHTPTASAGPRPDHVHVQWRIEPDETETDAGTGTGSGLLIFRDPRRFGEVATFRDARVLLEQRWSELGPDALEIEPAELTRATRTTRRAIKAVLLDQRVLAGVGNIYADESLFLAGIHPSRVARTLKATQVEALCTAIRQVLGRAIAAGGSTLRDFKNADEQPGRYAQHHQFYGRGGEACVRCGGVLTVKTLGQRTTVWCKVCQR
jgi:formamidopyrimidine-DNA glycosylase